MYNKNIVLQGVLAQAGACKYNPSYGLLKEVIRHRPKITSPLFPYSIPNPYMNNPTVANAPIEDDIAFATGFLLLLFIRNSSFTNSVSSLKARPPKESLP